jgi:predicted RND superfamily exporter protein
MQKDLVKVFAQTTVVVIALITVAAIFQLPKAKFDYKFESFFPPSFPDMRFYYDHVEKFASDNDFLLVGIRNEKGIFQEEFLRNVDSLANALEALPHVEKATSPTNLKNPIIGPMGVIKAPFLKMEEPSRYALDSTRIWETPGLVGSLFSSDAKSVTIFLTIAGSSDKKRNDSTVVAIEAITESFPFEQTHVAGKIKGGMYFIRQLQRELVVLMCCSFLLLVVFLYFSFRSLWGVLIPIIIVGIALIWMVAFMATLGKEITFMTVLMPSILLVVCVSNVIHIVQKYLDELRHGRTKTRALWTAFKEIGLATFLTSFTTAVGFMSLYPSAIMPIKEFGWIMAIGVYVSFGLAFSLLPSLLYLMKKPKVSGLHAHDTFWNRHLHSLFIWLINRRTGVLAVSFLLMFLSIVGLLQIKFDNSFIDDFASSEEVAADYLFFEKEFSGFRPFEISLATGHDSLTFYNMKVVRELDKIEQGVQEIYGAGFIISPNTFIKGTRRAVNGGFANEYKLPADEDELKSVIRNVKRLPRVDIRSYLTDDKKEARISAKTLDRGGHINRQLNEKFKEYMRTNVDPAIIRYQLTGMPYLTDKVNEFLAQNILSSLTIAFMVIALIMGVLFKSLRMIVIAILPNMLPLLLIAAMMGTFGIDLKISTSIIFAVAFGIAVDDTIHFMGKFRIELSKEKSVLYALKSTFLTTGKAIVITSLILISGFSLLIFSQVSSTFYIGLLVGTTLLFAVLADLLFLPVLVMMFYGDKHRPKRKHKKISGTAI